MSRDPADNVFADEWNHVERKLRFEHDAPPELAEGDLDEERVRRATSFGLKHYANAILKHHADLEDDAHVTCWCDACLDEACGHREEEAHVCVFDDGQGRGNRAVEGQAGRQFIWFLVLIVKSTLKSTALSEAPHFEVVRSGAFIRPVFLAKVPKPGIVFL